MLEYEWEKGEKYIYIYTHIYIHTYMFALFGNIFKTPSIIMNQKTKIMAFYPSTSQQIEGKNMEAMTVYIL